MAGSPQFKIYSADGDYLGSMKCPTDAAAVVALHGEGATVRNGHAKKYTVWTEGHDGDAGDSYDSAAEMIWQRVNEQNEAAIASRRSC